MSIRQASDFRSACAMLNDAAKNVRKARRAVQLQIQLGVEHPDRELVWRAEARMEDAREQVDATRPARKSARTERTERRGRVEIPLFGGDEC